MEKLESDVLQLFIIGRFPISIFFSLIQKKLN